MKTLIIIMSMSLSCFAQDYLSRVGMSVGGGSTQSNPEYGVIGGTANEPIKINAGKIKPSQWGKIYTNQISNMYMIDNTGKWWQTKAFRFSQGKWNMVDIQFGPSKRNLQISQNISGSIYLAYQYQSSEPIAIDFKTSSYADGANVNCLFEDTLKTYSYTTVLGAKKTVRIMTLVDEPTYTQPTFEQFVEKIKNGAEFKILHVASIACSICKGKGKVIVLKEQKTDVTGTLMINTKRSPNSVSNFRICPACKSKGTVEREVVHLASI